MRVLIVTPSFPRFLGDFHGRFIYDQCQSLFNLGIEIQVLTPRSKSSTEYTSLYPIERFKYLPFQDYEMLSDQTMKGAPIPYLLQLPPYLLSSYIKMATRNVDLIHCHIAIPLGFISVLTRNMVPKVITCHGSDCTLPLKYPLLRPFLRYTLSNCDLVISVSEYINKLAQINGSKRNIILPLGIDTNRFRPLAKKTILKQKLGIPENVPIIGTLGRIVPEKCIDDFIMASSILSKKNDFYYVVGGNGPYLNYIKKLAEKLEIKNILFTGTVINSEKFLQIIDVYVLTSINEGLSLSLQEAMATGCVPVAATGCGCEEIIQDKINGYLFQPHEILTLSNKILKAVENKKIGTKARSTIIDKFNIKKTIVEQIEIYKELLR
ncbi:glycosyltransferase family 4 protein [Candidatus Bathyarchaeota archaeon]|nr:glycosyltransferase family 4 protein [Candidatus Bathyarchaeota archaeon]